MIVRVLVSVVAAFVLVLGFTETGESQTETFKTKPWGSPNEIKPEWIYFNNYGKYVLSKDTGTASFSWEGNMYNEKLVFIRKAKLEIEDETDPETTDEGWIYKIANPNDDWWFFFSNKPFENDYWTDGHYCFRLYTSTDGNNFHRWKTEEGTQRVALPAPDGTPPNINNVKFPIKASRRNNLGNAHWMDSNVTISKVGDGGSVVIETEIWTKNAINGFHGAVVVFITDKDGNYLFSTQPQTYGVDAESLTVIGNNSDRTDYYTEKIPASVIDNAAGLVIFHKLNPKPQLIENLRQAKEAIQILKDIMQQGAQIIALASGSYSKTPTGY